jgi:hypothetical protein
MAWAGWCDVRCARGAARLVMIALPSLSLMLLLHPNALHCADRSAAVAACCGAACCGGLHTA